MNTLLKNSSTRVIIIIWSLLPVLFLLAGSAFLTAPSSSHSRTKAVWDNAPYTPSTWGGYIVPGAVGMPVVTSVHALWTVPSIAGSSGGNAEQWIGIGGYGNNNLIQFGTEELHSYDLINQREVIAYWAWIENTAAPNPGQRYVFSVSPGETIEATVTSDGWVRDIQSSTGRPITDKPIGGPAPNRGTADFILERNTLAPSALVNFGTVRFEHLAITALNPTTGAEDTFTLNDQLGRVQPKKLTMLASNNPSSPPQVRVSAIDKSVDQRYSDSFTVQWIGSPPPAQVTSINATVSPTTYNCSQSVVTFTFRATISVSPMGGIITYTWPRSDGATMSPITIAVPMGQTTVTVTDTWTLGVLAPRGTYWEQVATSTPSGITSNKAAFTKLC